MESLSKYEMEIMQLAKPSEQLPDPEKIVSWIAELTGQPEASVQSRLREEFESPGTNVARAFRKTGLEPYIWNNELTRFYEQTDAFLYELAIWNRNKLKQRMRRWVTKHLANSEKRTLDVLSIGDGLGFDSAYLARAGHRVTYFEVPGYTESFARKVFAECGHNITILTDESQIPSGAYDAVVCLDVLEHVPDPPEFIEVIAGYLRPGGRLIVHAPFYMIHPSNPTHLKANRRYSGRLSLYEKFSLKLVDGEPGWNPIVLQKAGSDSPSRSQFTPKLLGLRLTGWYLALGRFSTLPFWWVDFYRRRRNRWFDE
jgi:protein-L-isoaspartate O-methyltransferase